MPETEPDTELDADTPEDGSEVGAVTDDQPSASVDEPSGESTDTDPVGDAAVDGAAGDADRPVATDAFGTAADPAARPTTVEYTPVSIPKVPVAVAALTLLLAAAGLVYSIVVGPTFEAYTVAGETTSREELVAQLEETAPDLAPVAADPDAAAPEQRAALAQAITGLIAEDLLQATADEAGIEVAAGDVDAELAEILETSFAGDQAAFDDAIGQSGLSQDGVRQQVRVQLLIEGLADAGGPPEVTDEEVQEVYDAQFGAVTVSHILVETEEEAQAALERIEAGEDFAAVASEVSIDGSAAQGGQLGPFQPGQFVEPFEEAVLETEPGEITGPVETDFGFHLITVAPPPVLEDVRADIVQVLEGQARNTAVQAILEEIDAGADVEVDPAYGEWVGLLQGGVLPPQPTVDDLPLPEPAQQ